jgi:Helix-turn-helix
VSGIIPDDNGTLPQATPRTGTGSALSRPTTRGTGDVILGGKLRKCRLEGGHGLKQPAHFAGIKPSTLSDYEAGRSWPRAPVLMDLADFYGVSVDWLLRHLSRRGAAA